MAERLGIVVARGSTTKEDAALSRTIRSYLRQSRKFSSDLKVRSHAGVVELRGVVDSLWRKHEIETLIREVPGVERVEMGGVRVWPKPRSDAEIEESIRDVLRATSDVDDDTLAVTVTNGMVVLAGSVDDRTELARVMALATHVRGVKEVENLMTISPGSRQDYKALARRLKKLVESLLPNAAVDVSVFGTTAVISGTVGDVRAKRFIKRVVEQENAVDLVVDKLRVER